MGDNENLLIKVNPYIIFLKGILLHGPSGVGKTLAIQHVLS